MADLVYNATYYPITDTQEVLSAQVRGLFYDETTYTQALSILNGGLTSANFSSGLVIQPEHTQRGIFLDGWNVAGTANLDFSYRSFASFDSSVTFVASAVATSMRKAIPGGCQTVYIAGGVNGTAKVRLSWTVAWTNDNGWQAGANVAYDTKIALIIDGYASSVEPGQYRDVNRTITAADNHEGYRKNRVWSGHTYVSAVRGWHTYGLHVIQDNRIKMCRVWARSLNVVAFNS